ncbi:universal stress protein [Sphingomonas xanthus]|uniref:Universal stress protein n=2 Tax=Sphingomonas xanthus TaxID=2594473 RepID=A0A516IUP9_9SPHN|nr:universal stress protein [Sphingomonas xanthus]
MKLLACIDLSEYASSVCDHAAWLATRLDGSVELLHILQRKDAMTARNDLSGALGLGAKSSLLEELVAIEEAEAKLARENGKALLAVSIERLRGAGVNSIEAVHRHGGIVETIIEREQDADMVVIGKRGASADFAEGHLGSKVERVIRESIRPVLVASRTFRPIHRAMIAFDGGLSARKAVSFAATSALFADVAITVVLVGKETDRSRDALRWATEVLGERCSRAETVAGDVDATLLAEARHRQADLVIMGAYGHSPLRSLIVGSTATAMMQGLGLPILLFR